MQHGEKPEVHIHGVRLFYATSETWDVCVCVCVTSFFVCRHDDSHVQ